MDEKGIFRGGGPLIAWFKNPAGNVLSVLQDRYVLPDQGRNTGFVGSPGSFKGKFSDDPNAVPGHWE